MKLLTYPKTGGLLRIEVDVTNTPTWYYCYVEDDFHENSSILNNLKEHTLGKPHELKKQSHNWLFKLANPSDNEITCTVAIRWFQGTSQIDIWTDTVTVGANSGEETGDSLLRNPI
jgi:hypothetical protein